MHSKNEENSLYHQALTNAYEREIEIILKEANTVINRQKDALDKARDQTALKERIKELEEKHAREKKDSQR